MKHLFQAIESRQSRGNSKYSMDELKRVYTDANNGLDEKSSTTEFMDSLERIVIEIRSMTEHSQAFLQKVKKTEAPDYYNVISRPMDLATLQKRVKSQMYRHKKAFGEDLDLIWSNCLTYNSHPSHPLRHSAEILRAKSTQLLEFVTDPIPTRPTFTSLTNTSHLNGSSANNSARSTPRPNPADDGDDEGEQDSDEDYDRIKRNRDGTEDILMNGINTNGRDRSASPMVSQSHTPTGERIPRLKLGRGPLGRRSTPATPLAPVFEDQPSIIRTAESMTAFVDLDEELNRLDDSLGFGSRWSPPIASTSTLPAATPEILPTPLALTSAEGSSATLSNLPPTIPSTVSATTVIESTHTPEELQLLSLIKTLDPPSILPVFNIPASAPIQSPDSLWWKTITGSAGLASGIPHCGFVNGRAEVSKLSKGKSRSGAQRDKKGKGRVSRENCVTEGLGERMQKNFETLQKIKKLHLSGGGDPIESEGSDSEMEGPVASTSYLDTGIPSGAFRTSLSEHAGRESLGLISKRILGHVGFDGTGESPVDVLAHVAAEYIVNLGRTIRFYSDRYGSKMTAEEILLHALKENGVATPSVLESFVQQDIDRYGEKLDDLQAKLEKAKKQTGAAIETRLTREDSLEQELAGVGDGAASRSQPVDSNLPSDLMDITPNELTLYPPPPPFIPLTPGVVSSQIGLLIPFYEARQRTDFGLIDDALLPIRPKNTRAKVPPSGRIIIKTKTIKSKRDTEDGTVSKKKRKVEEN